MTVAVESGSQRVRNIVNKKLATDEIIRCAQNAQVGEREGGCRLGSQQHWHVPSTREHAVKAHRVVFVVQEGGLEGLKLYGMVGVPGEQEEGGWGEQRSRQAALVLVPVGLCLSSQMCGHDMLRQP